MSTATAFTCIGLFPWCPEHKTAAQLAAMGGTYVSCTLEDAMELIWLLETADVSLDATTKTSLQVGNTDNFTQPYTILEPVDRMCGLPGGFGLETDVSDPFTIASEDAWARLLISDVYYDTTNSNYAVFMELLFSAGGGLGDVYGTYQKPGWVSNGGTCTLFGSTVNSYKDSSMADADFSVGNPSLYTF